jgi:hypothetical protein
MPSCPAPPPTPAWIPFLGIAGTVLGTFIGAYLTSLRGSRAARFIAMREIGSIAGLRWKPTERPAIDAALQSLIATLKEARVPDELADAFYETALACWRDSWNSPDPDIEQIDKTLLQSYDTIRRYLLDTLSHPLRSRVGLSNRIKEARRLTAGLEAHV